jgi:hypothetical protein
MLKSLYEHLPPEQRAFLDRIRYRLDLLPRVDPASAGKAWFPRPARAALVISADLELGWAWRYVRGVADPLELARLAARRTRENFPTLLDLFDRFETPVTWATVGHLFLEGCERNAGRAHAEMPRPAYFENEYWQYSRGDWYDCDPCRDWHTAPEWYAPDLIRLILSARVRHEIACHTFSHIDCSEAYCPPGLMEAELEACRRAAQPFGLELKSFVFPANFAGNIASLQQAGFTGYRLHTRHHLGLPQQDGQGLWRIPGGLHWEKPEGWSAGDWIRALKHCLDKAIQTGTLLHLWFHPSCPPEDIKVIFPAILELVRARQDEIRVLTMGAQWFRFTMSR